MHRFDKDAGWLKKSWNYWRHKAQWRLIISI